MSVQTFERTAVEDVFGPCPRWCTDCTHHDAETVEPAFVVPAYRLHRGAVRTIGRLTVAVQQYDEGDDGTAVETILETRDGQISLTPRERADLIAALVAAGTVTA